MFAPHGVQAGAARQAEEDIGAAGTGLVTASSQVGQINSKGARKGLSGMPQASQEFPGTTDVITVVQMENVCNTSCHRKRLTTIIE